MFGGELVPVVDLLLDVVGVGELVVGGGAGVAVPGLHQGREVAQQAGGHAVPPGGAGGGEHGQADPLRLRGGEDVAALVDQVLGQVNRVGEGGGDPGRPVLVEGGSGVGAAGPVGVSGGEAVRVASRFRCKRAGPGSGFVGLMLRGGGDSVGLVGVVDGVSGS